jgi:predicted enzyme related to lactoylglutathione lyase
MANLLNWYEIPATDFVRAVSFYEAVLGIKIHAQEMNGMKVGFMPQQGDTVGGAIMTGPGQSPSGSGITIYFKAGEDLAVPLARVQSAGGQIIMPKTLVSKQIGHIALFHDTEGNRIGLHSMN